MSLLLYASSPPTCLCSSADSPAASSGLSSLSSGGPWESGSSGVEVGGAEGDEEVAGAEGDEEVGGAQGDEEVEAGWRLTLALTVLSLSSSLSPSSLPLFLLLLGLPGSSAPGGIAGSAMMPPWGKNM